MADSRWAKIPALRPDEVLYSWIGFLVRRNALGPWAAATSSLFGGGKGLIVDLPTGLRRLHQALGNIAGLCDEQEWIDRATLYPFHRPFIAPTRDALVQQRMLGDTGRANIKALLGRIANRFGAHPSFRFCEACVHADVAKNGEPYWRRSWLVPGATHCIVHGDLLTPQGNGARSSNPYQVTRVEHRAAAPIGEPIGSNASRRYTYLANELILARCESVDPLHLNRIYRQCAESRGYVTAGGSIRISRLATHLREAYDDFAGFEHRNRLIGSNQTPLAWLKSILRVPDRAVHPMCHVLLIGFLFDSMEAWRSAVLSSASDERCLPEVFPRNRGVDEMAAEIRDESLSCREAALRLGLSVNTVVSLRLELGIDVRMRPQQRTLESPWVPWRPVGLS